MTRKLIKIIGTAVFVVVTLFLLQLLFVPKYMTGIVEGALIAEYYEDEDGFDEKDHDVIFIGDCEVYENFIPAVLWKEYGIHSYIRGSAQQLIWQSYYLLEDTLRYEKPDVVVFNVLSMKYDEPQKEAYNRMSIDGMEWSSAKVGSILASMTEEESMLDYVFPMLRYHSRWDELNSDDFAYMFDKDYISYNGYYMRVDAKPVDSIPAAQVLPDYEFGENSYRYLDMMTELCKENDIELVLIKAPSLYPAWYDEWDEQMDDYAKEHDLTYINYLDLVDEVGIDWDTDTYDAGLHLNLYGAEKLSKAFGQFLIDDIGLESRCGEEELEALWNIKLEKYYNGIEEQKQLYGVE